MAKRAAVRKRGLADMAKKLPREVLKDSTEFRLYRLDDVAELFAERPGPKVKTELKELVLAYGTYRKFGEEMFFTEGDVRALFRCMAVRAVKGDPSHDTPGHVVFLGTVRDPEAEVAMIWCPIGQVEQAVKDFEYHSGVGLLDYVPATYGQYVQFRENHRASRSVGVCGTPAL